MPTQLHFQPGAAATNYRFRAALTYSGSTGTVTEITCRAETLTRFGEPNYLLGNGFLQQCSAVYDPMSGTWGERVQLKFPSHSIDLTETGTTSRVEIDGAAMTATVCGAWSLTFTELRWYVDGVEILDRFGRSVLDSTLGPYSVSGTFYLQKYNQTRVSSFVDFDPAWTHGYAACTAATTSFSIEGDASNTGGWGWYDTGTTAWIAEPITIDALACPAYVYPALCTGSCTCTEALPVVSETDAYTITVPAERYMSLVSTLRSTETCTCLDGTVGVIYELYRNVYQYREKFGYVDGVSQTDTSLFTSRRLRRSGCTCTYPLINDDFSVSDTTTTDALAYAPQFLFVAKTLAQRDCGKGILPCPETEGGYNPPICQTLSPSLCYYECSVLQDPVEGCACTSAHPSIDHSPDGVWVAVYTCDSDIYSAHADQYRQPGNGLSFTYLDTGLNGSYPDVAVWTGESAEWLMVYVDGGSVKYSISRDWGTSWSAGVTVDTGTRPRVHITPDNRRFITYLVGTTIECKQYDGAMTLTEDIGVIQSGVDASSEHDISSYSGGLGEWVQVLVYVAGGSIIAKTSNDGKAYT